MPIRILYAVESVFSDRDHQRLHARGLAALGFDVMVLDLTPLLHPGVEQAFGSARTAAGNVVACDSLWQAIATVRRFRPQFIWTLISVTRRKYLARLIMHAVLKASGRLIEYRVRGGPFVIGDTTNAAPAVKSIKRLLGALIYFPWRLLRPDLSFVTGRADLALASGQPLFVHSLDYDRCLDAATEPPASPERYLVFLDEDYAFHIDYAYAGDDAPVTPDRYYAEVNAMLGELGRALGLQPIVQLHPRADVEKVRPYWAYPLSGVSTPAAIRGAALVVTHDSTALQIAVLMNKPVILLETSEILKSTLYHGNVQRFAAALKCPVVTPADLPYDCPAPTVDADAYQEFIDTFVKTAGSPAGYGHEVLGAALSRIAAQGHGQELG